MRLITCLLTFALAGMLHLSALAQVPGKVSHALGAELSRQQAAWNRGDIAAFMEGYLQSDSLVFVGSSGPQYGWQNTYERYLRTYDSPEKMGQLSFTVVQISMLGKKHCRMLGKWHLTRTVGDVGGYFTLIWKRTRKGWKIIADHTS